MDVSLEDKRKIESAANALKGLGKATEGAKKLAEYKDLADLAGKLGKLSEGLGMLGGGLGAFYAVFLAEDDTQRILNAIENLSKQIERLEKKMMGEFKRLELVVQKVGAYTVLSRPQARFQALRERIDRYRKNLASKDVSAAAESRKTLRETTTTDIQEDVGIFLGAMGGGNNAVDLLQVVYKRNLGDVRRVNEVAACLFNYIAFAPTAQVFVRSLGENEESWPKSGDAEKDKEKKEKALAEIVKGQTTNAGKTYPEKLNTAKALWSSCVEKCFDTRFEWAKQKAEEFCQNNAVKYEQEFVDDLQRELSESYVGSDWLVIMFAYRKESPWSSTPTHTSGYSLKGHDCFLLQPRGESGVPNVFVGWVPEEKPESGRQRANTQYDYLAAFNDVMSRRERERLEGGDKRFSEFHDLSNTDRAGRAIASLRQKPVERELLWWGVDAEPKISTNNENRLTKRHSYRPRPDSSHMKNLDFVRFR